METIYQKVKDYLLELEYTIVKEDPQENLFVIEKPIDGIKNMIIAIDEPILIIEQPLFEIKKEDVNIYKEILKKNRDMLHGAMALDDSGKIVLYRDTLETENLDLNELEGSIIALTLLLSEFKDKILEFAKE